MQKIVFFTIFILLYSSSFTLGYRSFKGGKKEELTLNAEEVANRKGEQEERMVEATNKYGIAKANHKKAPLFSNDRSVYRVFKDEERHYERIHRNNVVQLAQIPNGGKIQLRTSKSGNRESYKILNNQQ
jgi:hypothetical protein